MIQCDGCRANFDRDEIRCEQADGHEGKYCVDCHEQYVRFNIVCLALEEKYNRLLDQEIEDVRSRVPLLFVPQDLPRAPRALEGLRLG